MRHTKPKNLQDDSGNMNTTQAQNFCLYMHENVRLGVSTYQNNQKGGNFSMGNHKSTFDNLFCRVEEIGTITQVVVCQEETNFRSTNKKTRQRSTI